MTPVHNGCLSPTMPPTAAVADAEERESGGSGGGGGSPPANPNAPPRTGAEVADGVTSNVFDAMFGYRCVQHTQGQ